MYLFAWTTEQETAFAELRQRMQTAPVLVHFDEEADTEVHTDVSNVGLGAVLVQQHSRVEHSLRQSYTLSSRGQLLQRKNASQSCERRQNSGLSSTAVPSKW